VDRWLGASQIGFGFGALAVGADIIIAEALLARGAELHVVLPVGRASYFAQSVDLVGGAWRERFSACMEQAASVSEVTHLSGGFEPLTVALAGDRSMGAAVLNARMLESRAAQLIIADDGEGPYGSGRYTARDALRWKARGHDQHVIICPRSSIVGASGHRGPEQPVPSRRLAAMLHLALAGTERLADADWPLVEENLFRPLRAALSALPEAPFLSRGLANTRILAFDDVLPACDAAQTAMAFMAGLDLKALGLPTHIALTIGGHYGIAHASPDGDDLYGAAVIQSERVAALAHPGSFTVTENFANALAFQTGAETIAEYVGDLEGPKDSDSHRLFAIKSSLPKL
jgi:class 3 adenylate cyclase